MLKQHYARCRALIFPGEEDFGMVPVEAMASGRPVVAFGRGGATETVEAGQSGVFLRRTNGRGQFVRCQKFGRYRDRPQEDCGACEPIWPGPVLPKNARAYRMPVGRKKGRRLIGERGIPVLSLCSSSRV
jgi:hypothetical protein